MKGVPCLCLFSFKPQSVGEQCSTNKCRTEVFTLLHIFHKPCKENPLKDLISILLGTENADESVQSFYKLTWTCWLWDLSWGCIGTGTLKTYPGVSGCSLVGRISNFPWGCQGFHQAETFAIIKKRKTHWKPRHFKCSVGFASFLWLVKNHNNTSAYRFHLNCKNLLMT